MNNYAQLASESEGVYYKVKMVLQDYHDTTDPNIDLQQTLDHTWSMTFGPGLESWQGVILIKPDDGADYVTIDKLRTWVRSRNIAVRRLLWIRHDGNPDESVPGAAIPVWLISPVTPGYLRQNLDTMLVPVELRRRLPR